MFVFLFFLGNQSKSSTEFNWLKNRVSLLRNFWRVLGTKIFGFIQIWKMGRQSILRSCRIFYGLHEDLRGVLEQLLGNAGTEEKKKLLRNFDEKQQKANKTLAEMEEELGYAPLFP